MCLCVHKVLFPWALFPTVCCGFSCLSTEHSSASLMCLFGIYSLEVEGCLFVCLLFLAGGRILLSYCSIWRTTCSLYLTHPLLFVGFFPSDLIYFESFCVENGVWCCVYLFFFLFYMLLGLPLVTEVISPTAFVSLLKLIKGLVQDYSFDLNI